MRDITQGGKQGKQTGQWWHYPTTAARPHRPWCLLHSGVCEGLLIFSLARPLHYGQPCFLHRYPCQGAGSVWLTVRVVS